ncbi:Hypothetical_protein [Hexamita inflata]|uniref:Hypothetical_protein n=1 Tax=Hexamita inflata TaxID=28002 RepID=A0AA86QYT1_9EUKA|nr:Hypothetical protein HINF_LOCUS54755 [Hexamita inflata]
MTVELQNQLNEKNEEISLLVSQISASINKQEEQEQELKTKQLQLNKSDDELRQLRIQLAESINRQQQERRVQNLEDQLNQSRTQLQTEKDQHNQSKKHQEQQDIQMNKIQQLNDDLQQQLKDVQKDRDLCKYQLTTEILNQKQISQKQFDDNQKLIGTITQLTYANRNLVQANNYLNQQVQQLKSDLTKQRNSANTEIQTLKQHHLQQQQESNTQLSQYELVINQLKIKYCASIIPLQQQLQQYQQKEQYAIQQIQSLNARIQQLENQVAKLQQENAQVKPEILVENIHFNLMNIPKRSRTVRIKTELEQIENMICYLKENQFNAEKENGNVVMKYTEAENVRVQQVIDHIKKELDVGVSFE